MKYQFSVSVTGFLEIEAKDESEAKAIVDDGFSMDHIQVDDIETEFLGEISG